jgi:hypothetical protein
MKPWHSWRWWTAIAGGAVLALGCWPVGVQALLFGSGFELGIAGIFIALPIWPLAWARNRWAEYRFYVRARHDEPPIVF